MKAWWGALLGLAAAPALAQGERPPYAVEGDGIPASLTGRPGDAAAGAALLADRQKSLCLLCHRAPVGDPHLQGTLAPDLAGVGARLSAAQIRLRIVDMAYLVPQTIMPSYYRADRAGQRVAAAWLGRTLLPADGIEDLVAYLAAAKE